MLTFSGKAKECFINPCACGKWSPGYNVLRKDFQPKFLSDFVQMQACRHMCTVIYIDTSTVCEATFLNTFTFSLFNVSLQVRRYCLTC